MPHWCLIGSNDFLVSKFLSIIRETTKAENQINCGTAEEAYFLARSTPRHNLMILTEPKGNLSVFSKFDPAHQIIWSLGDAKELKSFPINIHKTMCFYCEDLSDIKFGVMVAALFKQHDLEVAPDLLTQIIDRLDREDLFWSVSEVEKFIVYAKKLSVVTADSIKWVGSDRLYTVIDLYNSFLQRNVTALKILSALEQQDVAILQILGFFFEAVEKVLLLKIHKNNGGDANSFADKMKLMPYIAMKIDKTSSHLHINTIFRWYSRLCILDKGMKYSGVNGYTLLKSFILEEILSVNSN
jgi:hypothetical protein